MVIDFFVAVCSTRNLKPVSINRLYTMTMSQSDPELVESHALLRAYFQLGADYSTKLPSDRPKTLYADRAHLLPEIVPSIARMHSVYSSLSRPWNDIADTLGRSHTSASSSLYAPVVSTSGTAKVQYQSGSSLDVYK